MKNKLLSKIVLSMCLCVSFAIGNAHASGEVESTVTSLTSSTGTGINSVTGNLTFNRAFLVLTLPIYQLINLIAQQLNPLDGWFF